MGDFVAVKAAKNHEAQQHSISEMSRLFNDLFLSFVLVCCALVCSIAQNPHLAVADSDFDSIPRFDATNGLGLSLSPAALVPSAQVLHFRTLPLEFTLSTDREWYRSVVTRYS